MNRRMVIPMTAALFALGILSMTAIRADDEDEKANKEGQKAVLKLVEAMKENKGDAKAQAQAIKNKFPEVKPLMWVYKPRSKGGIGFDKKGNDIEKTLNKVGNARSKEITVQKRLDMRRDLARAAELSRVMAEITEMYANDYKDDNGKKDPAKWKEFTDKMRKGADELSKAAKGDDAAAIQKAAADLSASCSECHGVFRQ